MRSTHCSITKSLPGAALALLLAAGATSAQPLQPNQTQGFSRGNIVTFTYQQNFDCVTQPQDDLNYNGIPAQTDSGELQTPICQAGIQPTVNPAGKPTDQSAILYVLVPMFSINDDQNPDDAIACPPGARAGTLCGHDLGAALVQLFGAVPEAYKTRPMVFTDCPNPGSPPGTCTMHASTVDLGAVLVALGKLPPPATNVFLPTPNHSHVIAGPLANTKKAIWWEVVPVLVTNPADWPPENGGTGITSVAALDAAEAAGDAIEVPSNFFLFFSSQDMSDMKGMRPH